MTDPLQAALSLMGPLASALIKGNAINKEHKSIGTSSASKTITAAAVLGMTLAILRLFGRTFEGNGTIIKKDDYSGVVQHDSITRTTAYLLNFFRSLLKQALVVPRDVPRIEHAEPLEEDDQEMIAHRGSCHCGSIVFEVQAPRKIKAKPSSGKIQYIHAHVDATNFRLIKGADVLQNYYVNTSSSASKKKKEVAAHSFCSRCGVHVLHAPDPRSTALIVNTNCLPEGSVVVESTGVHVRLDKGYALHTQWDALDTEREEVPSNKSVEEDHSVRMRPVDEEVAYLGSSYSVERSSYSVEPRIVPVKGSETPITAAISVDDSSGSALGDRVYTALESFSENESFVSAPAADQINLSLTVDTSGSSIQDASSSRSRSTPMMLHHLNYYMKKHMQDGSAATKKGEEKITHDATVQNEATTSG